MLTVWRTLHLEIDSMAAPPQEDTPPTAPEYAERNFIKGRVLAIETRESPEFPGNFNQYFFVEPEATTPPLILADGSSQLPAAAGRFQKGALTFGEGAEAFVAADVTGNGSDATSGEYLEGWLFGGPVPPPYVIPYLATNGTLRQRVGTIAAWDAGTRVFTVDPAIPDAYVGGTLRVAGQDWPIAASDATVTIGGTQPMPMHAVDDDAATRTRPRTRCRTRSTMTEALADKRRVCGTPTRPRMRTGARRGPARATRPCRHRAPTRCRRGCRRGRGRSPCARPSRAVRPSRSGCRPRRSWRRAARA
jgi:hypothetical protein